MDRFLKIINESFELLVPSKLETLVLLWLHEKIKIEEIDPHFSYGIIQQAIKETCLLTKDSLPQTERILKTLIQNFFEKSLESEHFYKLTEYANRYIKLICNKIDNPFRHFPLIDSFVNYAEFEACKIVDIATFESWFELGFNATTKQTIIEHLESLKDEVAESIRKLNSIMQYEETSAIVILQEAEPLFVKFGDRAEEVKLVLKLGRKLDYELATVENMFYQRLIVIDNQLSTYEEDLFEAKQCYERSQAVRQEISLFFDYVDERIGLLLKKITFASNKLNEMTEYFKVQSKFKINLKKLFEWTMQRSRHTRDGMVLPKKFPRKPMPYMATKFIVIPYISSFSTQKHLIVNTAINAEYEKSAFAKIKLELMRQEKSARWIRECKKRLMTQDHFDLSRFFYHVLKVDKDVEIAIAVAFEIVQFANNHPEFDMLIQKSIAQCAEPREIKLWQMQIIRLK